MQKGKLIPFKVTVVEGQSHGEEGWFIWMGSEGAEKYFCRSQMEVYLWFQRLWEDYCAAKQAMEG